MTAAFAAVPDLPDEFADSTSTPNQTHHFSKPKPSSSLTIQQGFIGGPAGDFRPGGTPELQKPGPAATPPPAAWAGPLAAYLDSLAAAGYPATTRGTRSAHLCRIARGIGVPPAEVTGVSLVRFFARQQHWKRETRRGYRNSCVSFFRWMHAEGRIEIDPSRDLPSVGASPPAPRPAPDRVYRAALMAADPRVMLMLRLAAELGMRRAEVAQVHTDDLTEQFDGFVLVAHGKGGKERTLPVSDELAATIALGAAGHTPGASSEGYLFPGTFGGHLTPRYVGDLCGDALPAGWTMHKLRHRFSTRAYRGTRNLPAVQKLLGHASLATTQLYVATDDAEVRAAMMAAGPEQGTTRRVLGAISVVATAASIAFGLIDFSQVDKEICADLPSSVCAAWDRDANGVAVPGRGFVA